MKMEKTEDEKFIKFNSEVALRKGDDGWIINTLLENHNVVTTSANKHIYKFKFGYVFTKKDLKNNSAERWFFWDGTGNSLSKLYLKIPKVNESPWYDSNNFTKDDVETNDPQKQINFSLQKEYRGVWVSKNDGNTEWIFKNIDFWVNQQEYSEVFCSHSKNCQKSSNGNETAYKIDDDNVKTWFDSGQVTQKKDGQTSHPTGSSIHGHIETMINTIKDIKGDWVDMDEVCDLRWIRNLDNSQKQQLSMYCTNGKKAK